MAKCKVFLYKGGDIRTDQYVISKRRATMDFINQHRYEPLLDTELEIDETDLDGNYHYPKKEAQ